MTTALFGILILLTSVDFFNVESDLDPYKPYLEIAVLSILFFSIIIKKNKCNTGITNRELIKIKIALYAILFSVLLSSISAYENYGQSYLVTFLAQRGMYFYGFFFFLIAFNVNEKTLIRLLLIMAILFSTIYIIAFFSPSITNSKMIEERGTLRISLPGILLIIVGAFYSLDMVIERKNYYYIILLALFVANILLTGTRIIIGSFSILILLFIFRSIRAKKIFSLFTVIALFISTVVTFSDILEYVFVLVDATFRGDEGNYQIRLTAISLYFSEFFRNDLSYFIGNGFASEHSSYGQRILYLKNNYGVYQSDIGIVGDYVKYGLIYIICVLFVLYKSIVNSSYKNGYLFYSFLFILLSSTTISTFSIKSHIPVLCSLLYLQFKNQ